MSKAINVQYKDEMVILVDSTEETITLDKLPDDSNYIYWEEPEYEGKEVIMFINTTDFSNKVLIDHINGIVGLVR